MAYRLTIGLEVHAELATATKMFCSCKNDPDETRPNVNICPICLAHPGTLPVINKQAVEHVLRVGAALGATVADFSEFDRKSYFYPDIPKGYQISQYQYPLVEGGMLADVAITRVHLEEDTARSTHGGNKSLVDFNRAGIALMELVTEPVIHDAETAGKFARELQLLLRTLGASNANLEKGEMRIEANISVSKEEGKMGTKVEVKNINSFRSVERTIAYELKRQSALIESGGKVVQETRGWNDTKQETFSQRLKEGSADYRYFPEPDLPKFLRSDMPEWNDSTLQASLPELSTERRARYAALGLKKEFIEVLMQQEPLRMVFENIAKRAPAGDSLIITLAGNYIVSDFASLLQNLDIKNNATHILSEDFYDAFFKLMQMAQSGEVSSRGAKDILAELYQKGGDPAAIARELGLLQVHDQEKLKEAVEGVIQDNAAIAAEYRAGKEAALQYLVGQAMKATKGSGNPSVLREMLAIELKK